MIDLVNEGVFMIDIASEEEKHYFLRINYASSVDIYNTEIQQEITGNPLYQRAIKKETQISLLAVVQNSFV